MNAKKANSIITFVTHRDRPAARAVQRLRQARDGRTTGSSCSMRLLNVAVRRHRTARHHPPAARDDDGRGVSDLDRTRDGAAALRRGGRVLRPGARPRGARRARHRVEDVLRLRDRRSAPSRTRQVCPVCLGLPGSLPVVNAVGGRVDDPDRPRAELHDRGVVPVRAEELLLPGHAEELPDLAVRRADLHRRLPRRRGRHRRRRRGTFRVEIERVHMEEDTGKSLHVGGATGRIHGADYSLVDYNRAGIPLIEIVTKPVEGTGALAPRGGPGVRHRAARPAALARRLRRADGAGLAALRREHVAAPVARRDPLGTRTETKNVNSLRSVERAVRYEIAPAGRAC